MDVAMHKLSIMRKMLVISLIVIQVFCDETDFVLPITPVFNLHKTLTDPDSSVLEYDCLYYYVADNTVNRPIRNSLAHQLITYCFRPIDKTQRINVLTHSPPEDTTNLTFRDLKNQNITGEQLLSWSATIELVENYKAYLLGDQSANDSQLYYNCTLPWFGPRCEYAFSQFGLMRFSDVVRITFQWKIYDEPDGVPCYILLKCHRSPSAACLDWREICDGKIDCLDGGQDEEHCWQLEQSLDNHDSNEYRCHNGMQLIAASFYRDGFFNPDCLDRSDEQNQLNDWNECYRDPAFRCEEHSCRSNRDGINLPCGDGQCVTRLQECHNKRGWSLRNEPDFISLSSQCRDFMTCLTKMRESIGQNPCFLICYGQCASKILTTCPPRFPFPSQFIVLGHVFLLYQNNQRNQKEDAILPSYVCYDPRKCPLLSYQIIYNKSRCLEFEEIGIRSRYDYPSWWHLVFLIESYFVDHCSTNKIPLCPPSTMYRCANSSKCISKYRLLDGIQDCLANDDETYGDSCSLGHRYRFQCSDDRTKCLSPLLIHDDYQDCPVGEEEIQFPWRIAQSQTNISFATICDGFRELEPILIDGKYHTDETECEYWPCDNRYTRCNYIWNCPDGIDEMTCSNEVSNQSIDQVCVNWMASSPSCSLISTRNESDCSLSSYTNMICVNRSTSSNLDVFRKWTTDGYLSLVQICSLITGCRKNDYHQLPTVLEHQLFSCKKSKTSSLILCQLSPFFKAWIYDNTFLSVLKYDRMKLMQSIHLKEYRQSLGLWYCHRGLSIKYRNGIEQRKCLCPPSYYGDHCQYQNQRVSLTLRIETESDWRAIYTILVTLVDQDGMIESHDQIFFIPMTDCLWFKFNSYLLYRSRPKNSSKNFTIQIHAFNRHSLNYHGSWSFLLEFSFLPVHRLAVHIIIPLDEPERCSFSCSGHGQCFRFLNQLHRPEQFYCVCTPGWSGSQCSIPVETCHLCAPDSLCFDTNICLCRLNKGGPRCYLPISICQISNNRCQNGGQCIPYDWRRPSQEHTCLCPKDYDGPLCAIMSPRIMMSFHSDIRIPDFIRVHIIANGLGLSDEYTQLFLRIPFDQTSVSFSSKARYNFLWVTLRSNDHYLIYDNNRTIPLTARFNETHLRVTIEPWQRCQHVNQLFNQTLFSLNILRRMKYYHLPCQQQPQLFCFYDERHFCVCSNENGQRQAHCSEVKYHSNSPCQTTNKRFCQNGGQCLQNAHRCPSMLTCVCPRCFYGSRCQLTSKVFDLNLDAILGYHIQPFISFHRQPRIVRISIVLVAILFLISSLENILCIMIFRRPIFQEFGCGIYLLGSAIVSLLIMLWFTFKFCFLLLNHMAIIPNHSFLLLTCLLTDYFLRVFYNTFDWFSACIAIERAMITWIGVNFNKKKSRQCAKWIIMMIIIFTSLTNLPDPFHRQLLRIEEEQRIWCTISYDGFYRTLNVIILFFHNICPIAINFLSAVIIIGSRARQRHIVRKEKPYQQHVLEQIQQHKDLFISPCILVVLGSSRLILAFVSGCIDSESDSWIFLIGYFISFIPAMIVFVTFIVPSKIYKKESARFLATLFCHHCTGCQ